MRVTRKQVAVGVVSALLVGVAGLYVGFHVAADRVLVPARAAVAASFAKHGPTFLGDAAAIDREPPFPLTTTRDAGPLLGPRVAWDGPLAAIEAHRAKAGGAEIVVPVTFVAALSSWGPQWVDHAADEWIGGVDTSVLRDLLPFDFWDIESNSPAAMQVPFSLPNRPMPRFGTLVTLCKLRLLQGLKAGDAREAAGECRHAARLVHSTETTIGALVSSVILGVERAAFEKQVATGGAVEGWNPATAEQVVRLQRVAAAYGAYASPHAPRDVAAKVLGSSAPAFGKCAALNDGAEVALIARDSLESKMPERYREIGGYLATNGGTCRLAIVRRLWARYPDTSGVLDVDTRDICAVAFVAGAEVPLCRVTSALSFLPGIRPKVGELLLVSLSDPFRLYAK